MLSSAVTAAGIDKRIQALLDCQSVSKWSIWKSHNFPYMDFGGLLSLLFHKPLQVQKLIPTQFTLKFKTDCGRSSSFTQGMYVSLFFVCRQKFSARRTTTTCNWKVNLHLTCFLHCHIYSPPGGLRLPHIVAVNLNRGEKK